MVTGTTQHWIPGRPETRKDLAPGAHWSIPAGQEHVSECLPGMDAGMVANLCVEAQVRDATDDGFNAIVVGDAIATTGDDAHEATLANFGLLATEVVSTQAVVRSLSGAEVSTS